MSLLVISGFSFSYFHFFASFSFNITCHYYRFSYFHITFLLSLLYYWYWYYVIFIFFSLRLSLRHFSLHYYLFGHSLLVASYRLIPAPLAMLLTFASYLLFVAAYWLLPLSPPFRHAIGYYAWFSQPPLPDAIFAAFLRHCHAISPFQRHIGCCRWLIATVFIADAATICRWLFTLAGWLPLLLSFTLSLHYFFHIIIIIYYAAAFFHYYYIVFLFRLSLLFIVTAFVVFFFHTFIYYRHYYWFSLLFRFSFIFFSHYLVLHFSIISLTSFFAISFSLLIFAFSFHYALWYFSFHAVFIFGFCFFDIFDAISFAVIGFSRPLPFSFIFITPFSLFIFAAIFIVFCFLLRHCHYFLLHLLSLRFRHWFHCLPPFSLRLSVFHYFAISRCHFFADAIFMLIRFLLRYFRLLSLSCFHLLPYFTHFHITPAAYAIASFSRRFAICTPLISLMLAAISFIAFAILRHYFRHYYFLSPFDSEPPAARPPLLRFSHFTAATGRDRLLIVAIIIFFFIAFFTPLFH